MKLYKYVSPERINVLEDGFIRFTQPSELNDPFDMQFGQLEDLYPESAWREQWKEIESSIDDGSLAKAKLNLELSKQGIPNFENLPRKKRRELERSPAYKAAVKAIQNEMRSNEGKTQISGTFQHVRSASQNLAQISSTVTEQFGVLSMTDKPDNLLMWAHYADSHRGFVIELNSEHSFFNFPADPTRSALRKIEYVERRNIRTLMSEGSDSYKAFFLKSNYWSYESEWRLVRALQDADKKVGDNIHLFKLPEAIVSGVILGLNMKAKLKEEILNLLKIDARYTHVKIFGASPNYQEDHVDINPLNK